MAWQIVGIQNPAHLRTRDNQLVIVQDEELSMPIEDLDALIIDGHGITCSVNLLTELAAKSTTVVLCDDKHLPSAVLLPYSQHSRQAKVSRQQLAMSLPLKKQLWQKIIIQKIENQAQVLKNFNLDYEIMLSWAREVKSGDTSNRESIAARHYFHELLDDATRRKPIWHNAALNFGYAIVRSHIARHIAARGLVASQGVFHRSELNSFNLADDIIETYRPFVDEFVVKDLTITKVGSEDASLTKQERQLLIDILNKYVIIHNKKFTMKHAIERTVESLIVSIEAEEASELLLPKIIAS